MEYFKSSIITTANVWYKLIDKNGNVINDFSAHACFSYITLYGHLSKDTDTIIVYHRIDNVPYDEKIVRRWIDEINELGFPCSVSLDNDAQYYNFIIKLSNYKYKAHLTSTLMLIRALYETHICIVPDIYFRLLDADPKADKFDILQTAHKKIADELKSEYHANTNHMITYKGNGNNITKDILWERYKACGVDIFSDKRSIQNAKWNG